MKFFLKSVLVLGLALSSHFAWAKTLVVMSGGFRSCSFRDSVSLFPQVATIPAIVDSSSLFIDALKQKDPSVEIVWTCFSAIVARGSLASIAQEGPFEFHYGFVDQEEIVEEDFLEISLMNIGGARTLTPFFDFINDYIARQTPDKIYLIGHSYGGWAALQLGTRLVERGTNLTGVMLLEPISPLGCPASIFTYSLLLGADMPKGCQTAPFDFTSKTIDALVAGSTWTKNFYQTRFTSLHSGPMSFPGWDDQELVAFPDVLLGNYHSYLSVSPVPWMWARNQILGQ